ncbi:hypothetical protein [Streptomyces sp. R41]|uniref:Transposase n=1 Tax=Streptomyces sp. R41 TaxID=3238632 RepID=A0AB39R4U4_9ACTN
MAAHACRGEPELAAQLLGVSRRLWYAAGIPRLGNSETTVFRREYVRRLRAALGHTGFAEAVCEGHELGPDAAVTLALGGLPQQP